MLIKDIVREIAVADPEFAKEVDNDLNEKEINYSDELARVFIDEIIWALSVEYSFACILLKGYINLLANADSLRIQTYKKLIRESAQNGPTFARIMAEHLVPVLACGDKNLFESFLETVAIMQNKGTYTLNEPLKVINILLDQKDGNTCSVYIEILKILFSKDLTYSEGRHFAHILPKAVLSFLPLKRLSQTKQLHRILCRDYHLIDSYFDGLEKGLSILSNNALEEFVSLALIKFENNKQLAVKFLALESKFGKDIFHGLQTAAVLSGIRSQLSVYVKAKTGRAISICGLSQIPKIMRQEILNRYDGRPFVFSDGKSIYLPDEISLYDTFDSNHNLYKCLVSLESGYYEFGTFEFDIEKAFEFSGSMKNAFTQIYTNKDHEITENENCHDLDKFFSFFPIKELASDLFNIFEHGRIRIINLEKYPGLLRSSYPLIYDESNRLFINENPEPILFLLYIRMALGTDAFNSFDPDEITKNLVTKISALFENKIKENNCVETCAVSVFQTYGLVEEALKNKSLNKTTKDYKMLKMPFGRSLRQDLYFAAYEKYEKMGAEIKTELKKRKIHVFKSEIIKRLIKNGGAVSNDDIKDIIISSRNFSGQNQNIYSGNSLDLSLPLFPELSNKQDYQNYQDNDSDSSVFRYREWDADLCDYLNDHVRVLERKIEGVKSDFYINVLNANMGTVKRIRKEFESLRPDEIKTLKRWIEGEEFDICALPEYVIDKKAGLIPTDRIYIKRIKQQRDISALLLVDLSRSTSTLVAEAGKTVHEIIKEAIVLFCEALNTAQDVFAIAGFSGTGRLGVDYYNIKEFSENMDENVINRINAIYPQRRTRMGAAIRHAISRLENTLSKTRLLVIISDGFPNDTDYKQNYAIEDTRRAVFEAESKKICVRAITIDAASDLRLDDLYGPYNHNIISDVRDLPDRLLKIYGTLTKQ
ncbi:nitric oxide reductase activation protein NorD [Desulfobacterium sp. N47]|uniref:VWFA domain-containing protein n=1 Tax=uncultured Desulfobacterium sp. TaxID=201089 RepID=E1Y857_9BACT|nr:hypothetical protein N47_A07800 [uncultured Desulfobacterium sp.]